MHILLLSRQHGFGEPDGHLVMPFSMYREQLLADHDIRVTDVSALTPETRTDAIRTAFDSVDAPDAVFVIPHWSEPPAELCAWLESARSIIGSVPLVMMDFYDQTSSPHFDVLPFVDRYIKPQTLRDIDRYRQQSLSGYVYADFVADYWEFDLEGWHFGSSLPKEHQHKLVTGWNLGMTDRYRRMLTRNRRLGLPWKLRPLAVHHRFGAQPDPATKEEWYQYSRRKVAEALRPIESEFRTTTSGRVRGTRYRMEMFVSRIVVSPFGWGEVCFRDYEAVCAGALLVKPDMSHLKTNPDIFAADETYVPVQWDLSDLCDRIRWHLAHPKRAAEIIRNAQDRLSHFYETGAACRILADHVQSALEGRESAERSVR